MTSYEAAKILKTILFSSGGLLLGELGSSLLLGGKSTAAIASGENPTNLSAAYAGSSKPVSLVTDYAVGCAAQVYLERGCTWGQLGASTVIQEIQSGGTEYDSLPATTGVGATAGGALPQIDAADGVAPTTDFACASCYLLTRFTRIIALGKS